jgi:hypothetical protein
MKRLSDLLWEAKADAPPPRYDVGDVIAAGRSRRRRRSAMWTGAAAAVLVTVGVALVVPRGPAVPPVTAPTSEPTPFYTAGFRGYTAGDFVVGDPVSVDFTRGMEMAPVRRVGSSRLLGNVFLLAPAEAAAMPGDAATDPVNGHRAFTRGPQLVWEYKSGAWASVSAVGFKKAELRTIATALVPGDGSAMRVATRVSYVPDGFRLVAVGSSGRTSSMTFRPVAEAEAELAGRFEPLDLLNVPSTTIRISVHEPDFRGSPETVTCDDRVGCVISAGNKSVLDVNAPSDAEAKKIAQSVVLADLDDRSTWPTADEALPTSARFRGPR